MVNMSKDTEKHILRTARRQFVKNGFAATRMQQIADDAGINKAMLHYYFRSKEKLYREIIVTTLDAIIPKLAKAINAEGTFWERLETLVEAYLDTFIEEPDTPLFIFSELSQKRTQFIDELKKRVLFFPAIKGFVGQMSAEMQAGNIREMNPMHLLLNVISMTVFPFIARPVFQTIFEFSDAGFELMMKERKTIILDFLKNALRVD